MIEFDEPKSSEETIWKLRHCYEQLKRRSETKPDWKGNATNKGKWDKKQEIPQGTDNKQNVAPSKKFNASNRGQGHRAEEKNKEPMLCWTCRGDHHRIYCPQYLSGRP